MKLLKILLIFNQFTLKTGVAKPDKIENTDFKLALNDAAYNEVLSSAKLHLFLKSIIFLINEILI